jgi:hypothetical protein
MTIEARPSLARVWYEVWLYGAEVYYGFAQYCFWRGVERRQDPLWLHQAPAWVRGATNPLDEGETP